HIPAWEEYDNFIYLNPGSVSIPKEGSEHGYMIYEDKKFLWKTLEGNIYHTL
ncbi:MAG: phosphodiesterase, partial [Anaerostipes hadrus]|nr:phosphodiesterase [Anaerostipes hadrus]